ncbi:NAD(P)-dependent oxidoreductase [Plantactinospora siamensis]|uniref:NAD(P)-dependent oxidoreductase n=1 Tax=Plantactinospora siamensis TaxID=555372 RepID=A0ABV6NYZ5_9ACTN
MAVTRVGLVGTGRMGTALGERIIGAGFPLAVHNRTADRTKPLLDLGAQGAGSPAEVAAAVAPPGGESGDAAMVLTVLTDDEAVDQIYTGPDGLLSGARPGTVFVEASTIRTSTISRLDPLVRATGAGLVDAPLAGPPPAARAGQLLVMAGGTPDDLALVRPVLETYARRVAHVGAVGAGTTMKLVLMAPMGIYFAGLAEGLAMGARLGLDRATMLDVILDSHGAPPVLRDRAELLLGAQRPVGFEVSGVRKDLRAIVATAQDAGVPASTAAAALGLYAGATVSGYADADLAFIVDYVARLAAGEAGDGSGR